MTADQDLITPGALSHIVRRQDRSGRLCASKIGVLQNETLFPYNHANASGL